MLKLGLKKQISLIYLRKYINFYEYLTSKILFTLYFPANLFLHSRGIIVTENNRGIGPVCKVASPHELKQGNLVLQPHTSAGGESVEQESPRSGGGCWHTGQAIYFASSKPIVLNSWFLGEIFVVQVGARVHLNPFVGYAFVSSCKHDRYVTRAYTCRARGNWSNEFLSDIHGEFWNSKPFVLSCICFPTLPLYTFSNLLSS